jgi:L,D-transpeptidase-like protein
MSTGPTGGRNVLQNHLTGRPRTTDLPPIRWPRTIALEKYGLKTPRNTSRPLRSAEGRIHHLASRAREVKERVPVRWFLAVVLGALLVPAVATPADASHAALTLTASSSEVSFGESVLLSGTLTSSADGSPLADQIVRVFDAGAEEVGSDVTGPDGGFSVTVKPIANVTLHAEWRDPGQPDHSVTSPEVTVQVHEVVTVAIANVRLFGEASVTGRVTPANPGREVTVELLRRDRVVGTKHPVQRSDGAFSVRFGIRRVGTYRARAQFDDADHLPGQDTSPKRTTPLPHLGAGDSSVFVLLLERRLQELRYRLPQPDRRFDFRTGDAVLAFNKVQGRSRVKYVSESTWRALVSPRKPRPRSGGRGLHVEVDKTKQVLYLVRTGVVTDIVHVSTGRFEGWTRDGMFRVYRKVAGYSGGRLYYPSYFDGLRAIHGWPEVPSYPASHGCVRVPMWTAIYLFDRVRMGTLVMIYRS